MVDYVETCPDSRRCLNGSKCVRDPYKQGSYFCDCDEVVFEVHFQGLSCEHKADVYCPDTDEIKEPFYCTNGGTCEKSDGGLQWKCDCPSNYEGTYCEFVMGSKPEGWPYSVASNNGTGAKTGTAIGSVVSVIVLVILGVAIYIRYFQKSEVTNSETNSPTKPLSGRDTEIDADGQTLKDAVAQSMEPVAERGSLKKFSSTRMGKKRPSTRQSEADMSYAPDEEGQQDDSSMLSFT
mmetsp:Transcript_17202/g.21019  ORF Transcript_17202/g.21019 Transcript_17202/m.21019 type:complete len:236 (-) Transcript_17202:34-741(-)